MPGAYIPTPPPLPVTPAPAPAAPAAAQPAPAVDPILQQMYQTLAAHDKAGNTKEADYLAGQIKAYTAHLNGTDQPPAASPAAAQPDPNATPQGPGGVGGAIASGVDMLGNAALNAFPAVRASQMLLNAAGGAPAAPAATPPGVTVPPAYTPQATAVLQGPAGRAEAFLQNATDAIPFGDAIENGVGAIENQISPGFYDPNSIKQIQTAANNQQPEAGALGTATGLGLGAVAAAPVAGAAVGEGGSALATGAKLAGIGGASAAASTAANEVSQDAVTGAPINPGAIATDAALSGAVGTVVGGVGAGVTGVAAKMLQGASTKAFSFMANKLGMTADELQSAIAARTAAGQPATIQGVLDDRASGAVQQMAGNNPVIAQTLRQGQQAAVTDLPQEATQVIQQAPMPARPTNVASVPDWAQTGSELYNANDTATTAAINPIRGDSVTIPADIVERPEFMQSIPRGPKWADIRQQVNDSQADGEDGAAAPVDLTVGQADRLRQHFNNVAQSPQGAGSPVADLAGDFTDALRGQHAGYDQALTDYANGDNYRIGFNSGVAGGLNAPGAVAPEVAKSLRTPEGLAGQAAGHLTMLRNQAADSPAAAKRLITDLANPGSSNANFQTAMQRASGAGPAPTNIRAQAQAINAQQRSVDMSTPGTVRPADEHNLSGQFTQGVAETAMGMHHGGAFRMGRAVASYLHTTTFPEDVQQRIATGLTSSDPAVVSQTLNNLRAIEPRKAMLRKLSAVASGVLGAQVGNFL